jgi:hypothetical protein
MKTRRHHNKTGRRQIKTGSHMTPIKKLGQELGIPVRTRGGCICDGRTVCFQHAKGE